MDTLTNDNDNELNLELANNLATKLNLPIIIVLKNNNPMIENFAKIFENTSIQAVLASKIFHAKGCSISRVKNYLHSKGILVRRSVECLTKSLTKHTGQIEMDLLLKNPKEEIELLDKINKAKEQEEGT